MPIEDYITLAEAIGITGHKDQSQLRRAAGLWEVGDHKKGLRAVRVNARLWMTKRSWVERWNIAQRPRRGWPKGKARKPKPATPDAEATP